MSRIESLAVGALMLSWIGLSLALLSARLQRFRSGASDSSAGDPTDRPSDSGAAPATRDLQSWGGLALQAVGFALVWGTHRQVGAAWWPGLPAIAQQVLLVLAALLALASSAFAIAAVRELGKQWSLTARLLVTHKLVTSGPFGWVRHPIYSALLGLLVATGACLSTVAATAAGTLVYLLGTHWRAAREEGLLLSRFGEAYVAYAHRVPRLIPGRKRSA